MSTWTRSTANAFRQITRRDDLGKVLAGLALAKRIGFTRIKDQRGGGQESGWMPMWCRWARFARENGFEVRYIEFMPLDAQNLWDRSKVLLADDHDRDPFAGDLPAPAGFPIRTRAPPARNTNLRMAAARSVSLPSVSRPFCLNCNRIRLTADGKLPLLPSLRFTKTT